jgi:hypothetical protein
VKNYQRQLEDCVDELWRVTNAITDGLSGEDAVREVSALEDNIRAAVSAAASRRGSAKGVRAVRAKQPATGDQVPTP